MVCKTPRPSDQDIEIAVQKTKVLANTARSSLSKKAEIQRLQSALKHYLEAKDVRDFFNRKYRRKICGSSYLPRLEAEKK